MHRKEDRNALENEFSPPGAFATTEISKVGKSEVSSEGENVVGPSSNYTQEIDQMTELLRNFYDNLGTQSNWILIGLYIPIIPIAIIANVLVIVVVVKNHYMRSATNYFVVNLSVADLLVTVICMPMAISQAVSITWLYGAIMCKIFFFMQGVAVAASVFTITVMSIDRYLAIKKPIAFRRFFNRKSASIVILGIWLISLAIFGPLLKAVKIHHLNQENITLGVPGNENLKIFQPPAISICSEDLSSLGFDAHLFGTACFVLIYAIPGSVVLIVYLMMGRTLYTRKPPFDQDSIKGSASSQQGYRLVRERKRVAWILLVLAILFALCWLPYNVLRLLIDISFITQSEKIADILSYFLFLGHANSLLNPVVYCFMTQTFRRSISELVSSSCGLSKRRPHRNNLAVAAWACSSRGAQNRISLNQGTSSPGDTIVTYCPQNRRVRGQSATNSTAFDSYNSQCSPNRASNRSTARLARNHGQTTLEIAIGDVPKKNRSSRENSMKNIGHNDSEAPNQSFDSTCEK